MSINEMRNEVARLESVNDQLRAELAYVHQLLQDVGFDDGLNSLKSAALEILESPRKDASLYN